MMAKECTGRILVMSQFLNLISPHQFNPYFVLMFIHRCIHLHSLFNYLTSKAIKDKEHPVHTYTCNMFARKHSLRTVRPHSGIFAYCYLQNSSKLPVLLSKRPAHG